MLPSANALLASETRKKNAPRRRMRQRRKLHPSGRIREKSPTARRLKALLLNQGVWIVRVGDMGGIHLSENRLQAMLMEPMTHGSEGDQAVGNRSVGEVMRLCSCQAGEILTWVMGGKRLRYIPGSRWTNVHLQG
jgi:hypothetical protein